MLNAVCHVVLRLLLETRFSCTGKNRTKEEKERVWSGKQPLARNPVIDFIFLPDWLVIHSNPGSATPTSGTSDGSDGR